MKKDNLIKMGFVAHPHGIKGEAEIRLLDSNWDDCLLDEQMQVTLFPSNEKSTLDPEGELWTIEKLRFGNKVICHFKGVIDRTHLEKLIPFEIYLDRMQLPESDDDQIYLGDLIGVLVVNPEGQELGKLESFSDNGMQYLLDVRLTDSSLLTLPYVDAFFPEIDVENKKIVMIMPEYTE
jgi:16S rRNA processing protein RimM